MSLIFMPLNRLRISPCRFSNANFRFFAIYWGRCTDTIVPWTLFPLLPSVLEKLVSKYTPSILEVPSLDVFPTLFSRICSTRIRVIVIVVVHLPERQIFQLRIQEARNELQIINFILFKLFLHQFTGTHVIRWWTRKSISFTQNRPDTHNWRSSSSTVVK